MDWSRGLHFVLNDRPALDAFRDWLAAHHNTHPLDLHFALRAFERMANDHDERSAELAQRIYEKYVSARTGICSFPTRARNDVALRVRGMKPGMPTDPSLFDPLAPVLEGHLRALHEAFVHSDHFIDAFNQLNLGENERRRRRSGQATQLTAETLLLSRHEREHAASSVERMFATSARAPYTARPTTSQNDSAVSSSFSSDAPRRLRAIREEQIRAQPNTFAVPRVEQWHQTDNTQYDHSTEEGRIHFVEKLTKKLTRELARRRRNDATERQLRDIADRRCTAREAISGFAEDAGDEDDDLDRYVERMQDDSVKASAQRSPGGALLSPSEWSRRERSPDRREIQTFFRAPPPPVNAFSTSYSYKERTRQPIYDSSGIESNAPSGFSNASRTSRGSGYHHPQPQNPQSLRRGGKRLLTISYKGADGVPVVAHVPTTSGTLTLKEFRKHFSISSHANVQFFFKTDCEDGSAPYQLLLVAEDSQPLPVFDGRVSAELKSRSPQ